MEKMKKNKLIIGIIVIALLLGAGGGYTLYANNLESKKIATQVAYHNMMLPEVENYNDTEKSEYDSLLTERQAAFDAMDVIALETLQEKLNLLDKKVDARIELERVEKIYNDKKLEIEGINIVEGANEDEVNIFNGRKSEALQMVDDRVEMSIIDAKVVELKQTNTDIENRKTAELNSPATSNTSASSGYYDDSDDNYYGGGSSGGSGGSGTGGGTGGGYTPPTPPSPPSPEPETCITEPNGSTWCTGGDW